MDSKCADIFGHAMQEMKQSRMSAGSTSASPHMLGSFHLSSSRAMGYSKHRKHMLIAETIIQQQSELEK